MNELNHSEEKIYCRRDDKHQQKERCKQCPEYLGTDDPFNLFQRCRVEKDRFESLYKLYKRQGR